MKGMAVAHKIQKSELYARRPDLLLGDSLSVGIVVST